jgi:hypothetical protein
VPLTLFADKTPEEFRHSRLLSTAGHWEPTRARERSLGVNHWDETAPPLELFRVRVAGPLNLGFDCKPAVPGINVDHRIVHARLQQDYAERGGEVIHGHVTLEQVEALSEQYDLVVVCSGRGSMTELFPRLDGLSRTRPARLLAGALFEGIDLGGPSLNYELCPGVGEVLMFPFPTFVDRGEFIYFSAIPDGPLPALLDVDREEDMGKGRSGLMSGMLKALDTYFPWTRERIDDRAFAWVGPEYDVQGALTPTVRRPYAQLSNGQWVIGCGDVHVIHDPLMAQGANSASRSAFEVADAILEDSLQFDEMWCRRLEARMWEHAEGSYGFTNAMISVPTEPHVVELLAAATQSSELADDLATNFAYPDRQWNAFASGERAHEYIRRVAGEDVLRNTTEGVGAALRGAVA